MPQRRMDAKNCAHTKQALPTYLAFLMRSLAFALLHSRCVLESFLMRSRTAFDTLYASSLLNLRF